MTTKVLRSIVSALALGLVARNSFAWTYDADTHVVSACGWAINSDGNADGLTLTGVKTTSTDALVFGACETPGAPEIVAVGNNAFKSCTALKSVDFTETGLTTIGTWAFSWCSNLKSFKAPATLKTISAAAFANDGAANLDIAFLSCPTIAGDALYAVSQLGCRLTYPTTLAGAWKALYDANGHVDWAAAGQYQKRYAFTDGLQPIGYCKIGTSKEVWFVPVPVQVTDAYLSIVGNPVPCGTPVPAYGDVGKVTEPVNCAVATTFVTYRTECYELLGYRQGILPEGGKEVVYGDLVEASEMTFDESAAGSYVVAWQWTNVAHRVDVQGVGEGFGSVVIAEPPYRGETGCYAHDSTITLTATGEDGVPFARWYGDVPAGHERDNPLELKVDKAKSLRPCFVRSWTYANGQVTDGYWTFNASGASDAITIDGLVSAPSGIGLLDFSKPVLCDGGRGTFVTMAANSCYYKAANAAIVDIVFADTITNILNSAVRECANLETVRLPAKLKFIADAAFYGNSKLKTVTPFLPKDAEVSTASFCGCSALEGDLVVWTKRQTSFPTHSGNVEFGIFKGTAIASADFSRTRATELGARCFRANSKLGEISLPKTLTKMSGACLYECTALTNVVFRSFPSDGFSSDSFGGNTKYGRFCRRLVYPKGDAGWQSYVDAHADFVTWADAGAATNDYLSIFNDGLRPIGYLVHGADTIYGSSTVWLVPKNFGVGMRVLVR